MRKIVVDIYGADAGPETILRGLAKAMHGMDFFPVIVGDEALIRRTLADAGIGSDRYEILHTADFIAADEPATVIFGGRDSSSMALAYGKLKTDDDCYALLSPGNSGALFVGAICQLGLVQGLRFPVLACALPCGGEKLLCLADCGANMDCTAADLAIFARLGSVFCKCFCGVAEPRVGLMSVGREKGKGTALVKEAYDAISRLDLNFVGNLEGSDMVSGFADVVVTDGFSGNLLLKNTEAAGLAALEAIAGLGLDHRTMSAIRKTLLQKYDFNSRGAATFLGTKKTVVKMHGCATEETVVASVDQILRLEQADFSRHIREEMNR